MGIIDYSKEPVSDIAFIDMKSFYASVECVERGLHPLKTSLCVMYMGKRMLVGLMIYPLMSKLEDFLTITQKSRDFQRIQTLFAI